MDKINKTALSLKEAISLLLAGDICVFPTDTVYGLGAMASNAQGVKKLFAAKNRPQSKAIIALCADLPMAEKLVDFSDTALALSAWWPGALTLVLPLKKGANIAGQDFALSGYLGVRVPANDIARQLIAGIGGPIATTSANISGQPTPINAKQVYEQFSSNIAVLDGGECPHGTASTIVKLVGKQVFLLRGGAIDVAQIEAKIGISVSD